MLSRNVQRWMYDKGFESLREVQCKAIPCLIDANADVVISAGTASGKTEAAFLPACSRIDADKPQSIGILYISPLKALINDMKERLDSLGKCLDLPVTPWHGDVAQALKKPQKDNPRGILLITPESLEARLMLQMPWCKTAFHSTCYIIIDEFHAFIGSVRGRQLQSLLHRLEALIGRKIPRIALSATLENLDGVVAALRPQHSNYPYHIVQDDVSGEVHLFLKGYREYSEYINDTDTEDDMDANPDDDDLLPKDDSKRMVKDIYRVLHNGKSHLLFASSRSLTETLTAKLTKLCKEEDFPNEFFPHHGNLSADLREKLESRMRKGRKPTTAVCTVTLELGIDIGSVDSVVMVSAPHAVSSLRQRLGRSGRRGKPAIMRFYMTESFIEKDTHIIDQLRLKTIQTLATIELLRKRAYEPAQDEAYHFSTLTQQTLSLTAQYGSMSAERLWTLLCKTGPFRNISYEMYCTLLRSLGLHALIIQMNDGQLVLGTEGEKLTGYFSFYTAFVTSAEYLLVYEGKILGSIPISTPLEVGQNITFAGRHWTVLSIDEQKRRIELAASNTGGPLRFQSSSLMIHDIIRQEMRNIYCQRLLPQYLNNTAKGIVIEGYDIFHALGLSENCVVAHGGGILVFPWRGDSVTQTIVFLLKDAGLNAVASDAIIDIALCDQEVFNQKIKNILNGPPPTEEYLGKFFEDRIEEKYDRYISETLRGLAYVRRNMDIQGALNWMRDYRLSLP